MDPTLSSSSDKKRIMVSIVGHSFVKRLREDIIWNTHPVFKRDLGINGTQVQFVCKGG